MQNSFAISPYPHCRRLLPSRKNEEEFGMKKLIVFSVVLALMGTLAFADVTVSGQFSVLVNVMEQTGGAEDATMGQAITAAQANVSFGDENGGGKVRLYAFPMMGWFHGNSMQDNPFAFAWWKPMDVLRIQFGLNPDGDWGADQISGWGYNAEAQDYVAVDNSTLKSVETSQRIGFYGGFGDMGVLFSITPMDELTVNIALPFSLRNNIYYEHQSPWKVSRDEGSAPASVFLQAHLNVKYIMGIGIINFSFEGNGRKGETRSPGNVWASFYLTSLDNMALDIGLGFHLPNSGDKGAGMELGIGFKMDMGDLSLKARLGASLMREEAVFDDDDDFVGYDESILIGFGVLPYYDLGFMTFFFNAGVDVALAKITVPGLGSATDTLIDWYVNPYIKKSAGSINVYAGIKIFSEKIGGGDGKVQWAIPIGFNCYF
jgi:hypothetical protein